MADRIKLRRDTQANWTLANPTLSIGEVGIIVDLDPPQFRFGDGVTPFLSLPEVVEPKGAVQAAINNLVGSAPELLDTLNELSAALGDDPNFSATVTAAIAEKLDENQADLLYRRLDTAVPLSQLSTIGATNGEFLVLQNGFWEPVAFAAGATLEEMRDDLGITSLVAGTSITKTYDSVNRIITLDVDAADFATAGHLHDSRYYTETETNTLLLGKSDTSHTHDTFTEAEHDARDHSVALGTSALGDLGDVESTAPDDGNALLFNTATGKWEPGSAATQTHDHNTLYYTEAEINSLLSNKSDTTHNHTGTYVIANTAITGATHTKITYDAKGLVTGGAALVAADIPSLDAAKITTGTFANARISQANVTQHQAALSITESQISNLAHLTLEEVQDNLGNFFVVGGTDVTVTYDDVGNTLTINSTATGVTDHGALTGLSNDDHPQYLNSTRHTKAIHDALGIDADTVDGQHASAFAAATHGHVISDVTNLQTSLNSKQSISEKGVAGGYASLDSQGLIPAAELPPIAVGETFSVASQAAMLAVSGQIGDIAIRTDTDTRWLLIGTDPSLLDNWRKLDMPSDIVETITAGSGITITGQANATISVAQTVYDDISSRVVANATITGATYPKITFDAKGLVTGGSALVAADIPSLATSKITSGTFADARIAQTNVTQHQAALSITESQISNLDHLTIEEVQDNLGTAFVMGGSDITVTYDDVANTLTINSTATGVTDHGALTGLADDDHTQYYNAARHTKAVHDALNINADTVDGQHASAFATSGHTHSNYVVANVAITGATHPKITYDSKGLVTGGAALVAADIPSLDAAKITTGTFVDARIPSLAATKITSGTFAVARGGTGLASYTAGNYINAATTTTLQQRTPAQVLADIGAATSGHSHDATSEILVRNTSGALIEGFMAVYATGSDGNYITVAKANASSPSTMPVIGVTKGSINNNEVGTIVTQGLLTGVGGGAGWSDGQYLYASDATAGFFDSSNIEGTSVRQRVLLTIDGIAGDYLVLNDASFDPVTFYAEFRNKTINTAYNTITLAAADIPLLDAVKINTGTFADARIPSLATSKITSGVFPVARGGTGIGSYTAGNFISAATATTLQQRTPAQVLSDIGAATSSHAHSTLTAGTGLTGTGYTGAAAQTWTVDSTVFRSGAAVSGNLRIAAGDFGVNFWDSTNFRIHMATSADGRLDASSDYNMYFTMTGGTNRGFVYKNGTTSIAQVEGNGNIRNIGNLLPSGSVGIATATPEEALDVQGNARIREENSMKFGGTGAADSKFAMQYNASTESLDFNYVG